MMASKVPPCVDYERLAGQYAAAWNAHDLAAIMALHTEDTEYELHSHPGRIVGREAVRRAFEADLRRFPDLHFELKVLRGGEDHFVFRSRVTGTAADGRKVDADIIDFMTLRDGLVATKDTYPGRPQAGA
jgi:ketosteroid isomerase-like protein